MDPQFFNSTRIPRSPDGTSRVSDTSLECTIHSLSNSNINETSGNQEVIATLT